MSKLKTFLSGAALFYIGLLLISGIFDLPKLLDGEKRKFISNCRNELNSELNSSASGKVCSCSWDLLNSGNPLYNINDKGDINAAVMLCFFK